MNSVSSRQSFSTYPGGGEAGKLLRTQDWSQTSVGSLEDWPQPLTTLVRVMLSSGQPMFVAWGPERTLLYNDAYSGMLGSRHPAAFGHPFFKTWPEVREAVGALMDRVFAGEPIHMDDLTLTLHRNGYPEETHFSFSYTPVPDDRGDIVGLFCVCTETTAQVLAERRAAGERERQRHLLQQMPGFVALLAGPDHVYEYVNDAYVAISGSRDFIGHTVREVFPELADQGFYALLDHVYATGETFEARAMPITLADEAESRFIDLLYQPIRSDDGEITGIFVGGYDVTTENRSTVALRELNVELERRVIERAQARGRTWQLSPDLMGALNAEARFETSNPAWQTLLGWSEDEVRRMSIWEFLHPDDIERTRSGFDLTQIGQAAVRFPNRYRCKDGSYRWISWVGVPEDGLVYCTGRDITVERRQEVELAEAQEQLRQSQKLEAVGQLTGGVAHDFNNLLTVIKSSTDLLKRPNLPDDRRARYIGAISDTVDRAAKLTSQLLAFARRQSLKPEVFDVGRSVSSVADMIGTLTGSRIRVTTHLAEIACLIDADPSQFETAIVNMAVNARDAMDGEGTLTVTVATASRIPAMRAHPARHGDFVAVSISDTGSGIAPADIERIFEPFFTTKAVGQGTGLGLSQVFGFAKQSGGEIGVVSKLGEGTTFTLYLPRSTEEGLTEVVVDEPEPLRNGHGTRVLVVEDNVEVGTFATQTLAELGYEIVWAANAEEALAELAKDADRFDVVFSDVVMPGMNGIDLAHHIRETHHDLPVLLASGYSHVLAQKGTYGFELLHKPYSVEQLSRLLRKVATWQSRKRIMGR